MIDVQARRRLLEESKNKRMMEATRNAIVEGFKSKGTEDTLRMVFEKKDDEEVKSILEKIGKALPLIHRAIPRSFVLPKIFQIKGNVRVDNAITVSNLPMIKKQLEDMSTQLRMLTTAISSIPQQKIEFPKIDIPKNEKIDFNPILEAIQGLESVLGKNVDKDSLPVLRKIQTSIQELVERPTMTPQPVTNVNINALQGFAKSTAQTITTTSASVPSYGQLFNRRSIIVFNNDLTNPIYLGGSDVTTANGLPVLAQSFSPSIDAGYNMIIYAIASTSVNVRVFEISKDQTANVQE